MKPSFFCLILFSLLTHSSPGLAWSQGSIFFQGRIVEPSCALEHQPDNHQATMSCLGEPTTMISTQSLLTAKATSLPVRHVELFAISETAAGTPGTRVVIMQYR